jgi:ABC-type polysaccharide/polyol phosphate transport system ATPase subunit
MFEPLKIEQSRAVRIGIQNVSKMYRLYDKPVERLKEALWRGRRTYHKEFWALRDIAFEIGQGETVGIIGRNGSGKSTLLQLIAGIVSPSHGQVEVNGRVSALLELGSGFDPEFTGRENVFMNGAILGLSEKEIADRFEDIRNFAQIGEFIDQPVKFYSSGMFVRLAFATAVNVDPDILLVDEALAVGDAVFQHRCMAKIREIQGKGKTVLFVSHDTGAVQKLCTRAILLEKGKMAYMGKPDAAVQEYYKIIWNAQEGTEPAASGTVTERGNEPDASVIFDEIKHYDKRFGSRKGEVIGVALTDETGRKRESFMGGETVIFSLAVKCHEEVDMPMSGFIIKDLLGNELIKTNTDAENAILAPCPKGSVVHIGFSFTLPNFKAGSYAISAGFGNGTLQHHMAYDWLDNMYVFHVDSLKEYYGIVGMPITVNQKFIEKNR